MKTKLTLLGCAVAVAGAATYLAGRASSSTEPVVNPAIASSPAQLSAPGVTAMRDAARCKFQPGWAASYDYSGSVRSKLSIQGMAQPVDATQEVSAKLAFELLDASTPGEWVLLGQFSGLNETLVKTHGAAFETPFLVKIGEACDVRGFARSSALPKKTAQIQQVAMHDLFIRAPAEARGEGAYENGTGLAWASFASEAGGAVINRTIKRYDMAWRVKNTFQVTQSYARAQLDHNWIERFQSQEGISGGLVTSAVSTLEVTRESHASAKVADSASRTPTDYVWENLLAGVYAGTNSSTNLAGMSAAEVPYVEAMKDSNIEAAFGELLNKVEAGANVEEQWHEMAGYLNGHPEKIGEFAQGLAEADFPEQAKAVSYLVLNKTAHPQARDALTALRGNQALSVGDRTRASLALVTRKDVGVELAKSFKRDALEATSGNAEDDFVARNALLHLGILAGAHKEDLEVGTLARDAVKSQLGAAGGDTYLLSPALGAAGNLGDPALLSTLVGYTHHEDYRVRALVPKSLRGYAYAQTEEIFVEWLARETHPDVKEEILDILFHQLATAQRKAGPGVVREAIRHLKMKPLALARQSIVHLIGPLKDTYPEAKLALIEQVPEEFRNRSGIFNQIGNYLAPRELELALSRMPEFAHQYGPAQQAQVTQDVLEIERNQPKVRPMEAP